EVRLTKEAYGWDPDKHFYVPEDALANFRRCCERGRELESEWQQRFDAYAREFPEQAQLLRTIGAGQMPEGWDVDLPRFEPSDGPVATRVASGKSIQWAAKRLPFLVGGSADLATSNNTDIEDGGAVEKGSYDGRNLRFGVREHAMGAIVNGLTLHGLRAFGGTFLTFSDYMRGAVRLSALMKLPSIWVYTHDSIGLGEDGPTHQPIEQLAGLRAVPRLNVVRPADANETALGWRFALRNIEAPTAFALSRQNLPILDPDAIPDDAIERGAYVLRDAEGGDPELILIGTGSEVSLCLEAADALPGARVRVVSMPCMDTFTKADESYREQVLPAACRARIAVEAASPLGWDKWIGPDGVFVGMETFGESGPAKQVFEHFGITAEHVAALGRDLLGR
ncbi:MAG: transketolase-like TK C-terminal-containing protein, partial [Solirubrobacteraceae bacterium]